MESAPESPFEELAGRRFALYPALRGVEHNEWTLEQETWSEILAKNVETEQEIWIPRAHLGEISSVDEPVLILGLKRELELKAGEVRPYRQRVVSMPGPSPVTKPQPEGEEEPPEPVRTETHTESRTLSLIGRAVAIGVAALLLLVLVASGNLPNPIEALFREGVSTADQRYLSLAAQDGYFDVKAKMGDPQTERWITKEEADLHFQLLEFPGRRYTVVGIVTELFNSAFRGAVQV